MQNSFQKKEKNKIKKSINLFLARSKAKVNTTIQIKATLEGKYGGVHGICQIPHDKIISSLATR